MKQSVYDNLCAKCIHEKECHENGCHAYDYDGDECEIVAFAESEVGLFNDDEIQPIIDLAVDNLDMDWDKFLNLTRKESL